MDMCKGERTRNKNTRGQIKSRKLNLNETSLIFSALKAAYLDILTIYVKCLVIGRKTLGQKLCLSRVRKYSFKIIRIGRILNSWQRIGNCPVLKSWKLSFDSFEQRKSWFWSSKLGQCSVGKLQRIRQSVCPKSSYQPGQYSRTTWSVRSIENSPMKKKSCNWFYRKTIIYLLLLLLLLCILWNRDQ